MSEIELGKAGTDLRRNAIGVSHIVFFVVAAAAPLTAVVGASPAAFAFGNGPGVPATYLLVGVLYLLFSVGFTAMSRFIGSAGGFYPYIAAVSAALLAWPAHLSHLPPISRLSWQCSASSVSSSMTSSKRLEALISLGGCMLACSQP